VRLDGFGHLLAAFETIKDPGAKDAFLPCIERDLVKADLPAEGDLHDPGRHRFTLQGRSSKKHAAHSRPAATSTASCCGRTRAGGSLLDSIAKKEPWSSEQKLVDECEEGVAGR